MGSCEAWEAEEAGGKMSESSDAMAKVMFSRAFKVWTEKKDVVTDVESSFFLGFVEGLVQAEGATNSILDRIDLKRKRVKIEEIVQEGLDAKRT